jgi:hypothetical protein
VRGCAERDVFPNYLLACVPVGLTNAARHLDEIFILTRSTPALFSSDDSSGILRWTILSSSWFSPQEYISRLDAENDPAPDCTGRLRFRFCSRTSTKNHAYTFSVFDKSRFSQLQGACGAQCLSLGKSIKSVSCRGAMYSS